MKTIILAGGYGSRMREETEFKPKPMVEIGGKPMLWHILKFYKFHGHHDFLICMGYKQEKIIEYFINFDSINESINIDMGKNNILKFQNKEKDLKEVKVTLVDTGLDTNTGGRINKIKDKIVPGESFMITYGDGLSNVDIKQLIEFHNSHDGIATFSATRTKSRFGVIETNKDNLVTSFDEKGDRENRINCGFMVCDYEVFNYINGDESFEQKTLKNIASKNKLYAYDHNGYFQPMDTYREAIELNKLWKENNAPWKVWND